VIAEIRASVGTPPPPEWADKDHNPYGSERAFLDAARRREFPTFTVRRRVTAEWSHVVEAIQKKRREKKGAEERAPDDIARLVEESRPGRGRGVR
jgi:hypothetical protein